MKGIVPSLNTPFSKKGSLDQKSLAKLVEHTIKSGCNGMLGLAVAGEGQSLSFEEKIDFIVNFLIILVNRPSPTFCTFYFFLTF